MNAADTRFFSAWSRIQEANMKPICIPCRRFFSVLRSGFYFLEGMPKDNGALPGTAEPEKWQPYKLWAGDIFECEGCGAKIISGTAPHPIAERHHVDFEECVARLRGDQFQVNDC
jgi:hypothetical protein